MMCCANRNDPWHRPRPRSATSVTPESIDQRPTPHQEPVPPRKYSAKEIRDRLDDLTHTILHIDNKLAANETNPERDRRLVSELHQLQGRAQVIREEIFGEAPILW